LIVVPVVFFFSGCGSSNTHTSNGTTSGSGTGSGGTGSGSGGSGSGSSHSVPGYGEGIGASGQTGAAKFLYANPLPGGGPFTADIQSNGTLTLQQGGSANNVNPMTMAIDPSGAYLYQVAQGYNGGIQGGILCMPSTAATEL